MTGPTISYADENYEEVFLVGVRLQPHSNESDLYALVLYYEVARGDKNRPLTSEGRIAFFRDTAHANRALGLGDAAFRKYGNAPVEVAIVYDLPKVLETVRGGEVDEDASVLNLLNELADFVVATGHAMPEPYQQMLARFADWLTFNRNFSTFFTEHRIERSEIMNALLWSVGAVAAQAVLVE